MNHNLKNKTTTITVVIATIAVTIAVALIAIGPIQAQAQLVNLPFGSTGPLANRQNGQGEENLVSAKEVK
jgi:hypothetical protein